MRFSLYINSEIMVCCKVEPHYLLVHSYYSHCQNSIFKLFQLTLLPFFKNATVLVSTTVAQRPLFLLFTHFNSQQVLFVTF